MTPEQQKIAEAVLQESASTARRSFARYMEAEVTNGEPSPSAGGFLEHAAACEAAIVLIRTLTQPTA